MKPQHLKAVIFDMDGVIIDSETLWPAFKQQIIEQVYGFEIYQQMKPYFTIGTNLYALFIEAKKRGLEKSEKEFYSSYHLIAEELYQKASLTENIDQLLERLSRQQLRLGLVSSSPKRWVEFTLRRLECRHLLECALSVDHDPYLAPKPAPDGYLHAMKLLAAQPSECLIIEDSNRGIKAAKASGAFVIGFQAYLPPGYLQQGADLFASSANELSLLLREITAR